MPVIIRGRRVMFLQSQPGDGPQPVGADADAHPWYTGRWSIAAHHRIYSEAMADDEDWARYCRAGAASLQDKPKRDCPRGRRHNARHGRTGAPLARRQLQVGA